MSGSVWVLSDTNCKKKWEEQEYWKGVKLILKQARTWEEFVCVCSLRCFKYRGGDDASMWRDTIYSYIRDYIIIPDIHFPMKQHWPLTKSQNLSKPIYMELCTDLIWQHPCPKRHKVHSCFPSTAPSLVSSTLVFSTSALATLLPSWGLMAQIVSSQSTNLFSSQLSTWQPKDRDRELWEQSTDKHPKSETYQSRTVAQPWDNCTNSYLKSSSFLMWTAGSNVFTKTFTTVCRHMLIGQRYTGHEGRYKYHELAHNLDGSVDVSTSQLVCAWDTNARHIRKFFQVLEWCGLEI